MKTFPLIIGVLAVSQIAALAPSIAEARCTDSDPANDPAAIGMVVDGTGRSYTDSCVSDRLVQVSCDATDNAVLGSAESCPTNQICRDGVCMATASVTVTPFIDTLFSSASDTTTRDTDTTTPTTDTRTTSTDTTERTVATTTEETPVITTRDSGSVLTTEPVITTTTRETTLEVAPTTTTRESTTIVAESPTTTTDTRTTTTDTTERTIIATTEETPVTVTRETAPTTATETFAEGLRQEIVASTDTGSVLTTEPVITTTTRDTTLEVAPTTTTRESTTIVAESPTATTDTRTTTTDTTERTIIATTEETPVTVTRETTPTTATETFAEGLRQEIVAETQTIETVRTATTDATVRIEEGASTESTIRCRDAEYYRAHLDECRLRVTRIDSGDVPAMRVMRESRCRSGESFLQSKSSVFDVTNAKLLELPAPYTASRVQKAVIVESNETGLRQYIVIPMLENGQMDALIINPLKGLVRILNLGPFNAVHVLKNENGAANVLALSSADGVKFVTDAFSIINDHMKDATLVEQLPMQVPALLIEANSPQLNVVQLPQGGAILSAHSFDKSMVLVRGDGKTAQDIIFLDSLTDASPKVVPLDGLKDYTYRWALLAPEKNQLETALITMKNDSGVMTVFHTNNVLADNVVFEKTEMPDATQDNVQLKKVEGKNVVKKSESAIKSSVSDKDHFNALLAEAVSAKTYSGVAVTHPFEDFGKSSNAIVLKDAGFGFVKMGNNGVQEKEDELIVPQDNGAACAVTGDAVAVDVDHAGGKDLAIIVFNGEMVSLVFYPNINQVQKFVSVTAEAKPEGIQLNQQSETEENETLKCHWEAYEKKSDGTLKDVSTQLSSPNVCNPVFKPVIENAGKLNQAVQWVMNQIISNAYAAETAATDTEYVFRVTTIDPMGEQATAEVTAVVSKSAGSTSTIKVTGADVLTQTQAETVTTQAVDKGGQQTATSGSSTTIANDGLAGTAPVKATTETETTKVPEPAVTEVASRGFAMEGGFGCALIRPTASAPAAPMTVRAEVSEAPGFFARIRAAIAKVVTTTIATIGDFFQTLGGKVRASGNDVAVAAKPEPIKITAAPIVMSASDAQRTLLMPVPMQAPAPVAEPTAAPDDQALSASMPTQPTSMTPPITAPRSVITIQSSAAPAPRPLGPSSPAAAAPASAGPSPTAPMSHGPVASRDVLNLENVNVEESPPSEALPSSPAAPASERPVASATAGAPLRSTAPQVAAAPSPPPASPVQSAAPPASAAIERPAAVTTERPVAAPPASTIQLPVTTFSPSPTSITGERSAVASRPVVSEPTPVATRPAPVEGAPAAPLAAELPETRPATIAVRPEVSCNDLSFVIANRTTCRCVVRDTSLGNILPLAEADRGTPHAVSIQNGKVVFNPSLFLRDALNCPVDPVLPQPIVPSFELPQPRVRGEERGLLVANVFVTPEGRLFGIAVDDAEGHKIRGIASWDVGPTAAATILSFKQFPEFLQLNETIRGMMVTKEESTGRNAFDITFINRSGTQVPHHCNLSRDDMLTCTEPEPVRQ